MEGNAQKWDRERGAVEVEVDLTFFFFPFLIILSFIWAYMVVCEYEKIITKRSRCMPGQALHLDSQRCGVMTGSRATHPTPHFPFFIVLLL